MRWEKFRWIQKFSSLVLALQRAKWVTRKTNNTKTTGGKKGGNSKFVKSLRKTLQKKRKCEESHYRGYTMNLDVDLSLSSCLFWKALQKEKNVSIVDKLNFDTRRIGSFLYNSFTAGKKWFWLGRFDQKNNWRKNCNNFENYVRKFFFFWRRHADKNKIQFKKVTGLEEKSYFTSKGKINTLPSSLLIKGRHK